MNLILIGCEYSGTTTLAHAIRSWLIRETGAGVRLIHDHWKLPHTSGHFPSNKTPMTKTEMDQVMALSPTLKEMTQRHSLVYHTPSETRAEHGLVVGYHFDDGIYGSLYFGYGGNGDNHDRSIFGRELERILLKHHPETVLVLVKATSSVIHSRMAKQTHHSGVLQEKDIDFVKKQFNYEFNHSLISKKIILDTSASTVEESMKEFSEKIWPYLTESDRSRMLLNRVK